MRIQKLEQLRELIKEGWKLDAYNYTQWNMDASNDELQYLEANKYRLKSPSGDIIPVEYCKGDLDEHTFKVGDRVRCKPGYTKDDRGVNRGGYGYNNNGKTSVIQHIDSQHIRINDGYVWPRALELVETKVEETLLEKAKRLYPVGTRYYNAHPGGNRNIFTLTRRLRSKLDEHKKDSLGTEGEGWVLWNGKWAEIIEEESNLEKANRLYPKGTRFMSAMSKNCECVVGDFYVEESSGIHSDNNFVYYEGKWADIVTSEESNAEKAKRLYPLGTKYISIKDEDVVVSSGCFNTESQDKEIWGVDASDSEEYHSGYVFHNGKWADIVDESHADGGLHLKPTTPKLEEIEKSMVISTGQGFHLSKESQGNTNTIQDVRRNKQHREEGEIDELMDSLLRSKRRNRATTRASKIQSIIEEDYRED